MTTVLFVAVLILLSLRAITEEVAKYRSWRRTVRYETAYQAWKRGETTTPPWEAMR